MKTLFTILSNEGDFFDFGGLGVHWKIDGKATASRFAVVHHPMAPHALAAPLHRHHNEDEYSYVIRGTLGALLADKEVTAEPGTWVFKPRGQWHTFGMPVIRPARLSRLFLPPASKTTFEKSPQPGEI